MLVQEHNGPTRTVLFVDFGKEGEMNCPGFGDDEVGSCEGKASWGNEIVNGV